MVSCQQNPLSYAATRSIWDWTVWRQRPQTMSSLAKTLLNSRVEHGVMLRRPKYAAKRS